MRQHQKARWTLDPIRGDLPAEHPSRFGPAEKACSSIDTGEQRREELVDPTFRHPIPQETFNVALTHIVPPSFFFFQASTERQKNYYRMWVRVRPAWLLRVATERVEGLSGQAWRDVLSGNYKRKNPPVRSSPASQPITVAIMPQIPFASAENTATTEMSLDSDEEDILHLDLLNDGYGYVLPLPANEVVPLRTERQRSSVEPVDWRQRGVETWIQHVEDPNVIRHYGQTHARQTRLDLLDLWDVWLDYQRNRKIYFCHYIDMEQKGDALGERYISEFRFLDYDGQTREPSRRIWKALTHHITCFNPNYSGRVDSLSPDLTRSAAMTGTSSTLSTVSFVESTVTLDPVFGYEDFNPNGALMFDGLLVREADLDGERWRRYLLWEMVEINFRSQFRGLDTLIRRSYADKNLQGDIERDEMVRECWGGQGVLPGGDLNPLFSLNWSERSQCVQAMIAIMRTWPRLPSHLRNMSPELNEKDFLQLESLAWQFYCQSYVDFYARYPDLPCTRPPKPVD
jgi:hypothetical protein